MSEAVARIMTDFSQLSPEEQREVADEVVRFGNPVGEKPDEEWDMVIARRLEEMNAGKVQGIPADEAFAMLKARRA